MIADWFFGLFYKKPTHGQRPKAEFIKPGDFVPDGKTLGLETVRIIEKRTKISATHTQNQIGYSEGYLVALKKRVKQGECSYRPGFETVEFLPYLMRDNMGVSK